jgi:RecJ-like exonuclease
MNVFKEEDPSSKEIKYGHEDLKGFAEYLGIDYESFKQKYIENSEIISKIKSNSIGKF